MHVITSISRKGGVGKTTALMALAGAAAHRGINTVLIDTDSNLPMSKFQVQAEDYGYWEPNLKVESVFEGGNTDIVERVNALEGEGVDLVLIDTKGGEGDFVGIIAQLVDFIIVPTQLSAIDVDGTENTIAWLEQLKANGLKIAPHAVLISKMPAESNLSKSNRVQLDDIIENFDLLTCRMPISKVIVNQAMFGLMHKIIDDFLSTDAQKFRLQARAYQNVLSLYEALYDEIIGRIDA